MECRYLTIAVCAALCTAPLIAVAGQTMYRCGNKYQDSPCESGEGSRVGKTSSSPQTQAQPYPPARRPDHRRGESICSKRPDRTLKLPFHFA